MLLVAPQADGSLLEGSGTLVARRTRTWVWQTAGQDAATLIAASYRAADGRSSWSVSYPGSGKPQWTRSLVEYLGNGALRSTAWAADGSYTVSESAQGRTTAQTRYDAAGLRLGRLEYGYDAYGRQTVVEDVRKGATTYVYDAADQVLSQTQPAPATGAAPPVTSYQYDARGRVLQMTLPDGGIVQHSYWPTGELRRTWGSRSYPVEYGYARGRLASLTTWQDFAGDSGRAVTTWSYDLGGRLTAKRYADGHGPDYAWTAAGRLASRTWGRGLLTEYAYDAAGSLTGIAYHDAGVTPDVDYSYDRLGRRTGASAGALALAVSYDAYGRVAGESWTGGPLAGLGLAASYDSHLRRSQLTLRQGERQVPGAWLLSGTAAPEATVKTRV